MNRRNLPLVALRSFEAAARHMSMKLAAVELGVTPSAVSQQIRSIEDRLKVELFARGHRQLTLTADGTELFRTLSRNFTEIEQALEHIVSGPGSRKIRLKLLPSLAIRWLVPRLADFHGRHPEFDVEVATGLPIDDATVDDADFACRLGNGQWPGLCAIRLFPDAFVPVCAPSLASAIRRPSDMFEHPLLHSMMRMEAWRIWCDNTGVTWREPPTEIRFANAALAYQAAADGLGIAMAQQAYVETDLAAGRLQAPFGTAVYTGLSYFLVCSSHKAMQRKNQVFSSWMQDLV